MRRAAADDARTVSTLAALVALVVALVALVVRVMAARAVRELLGFPFPAHRLGVDGSWDVLLDNVRLAATPLAAAALLTRMDRALPGSRRGRLARRAFDALLLALVAVNVIVVGASYGAYGWRMVRYTLPHGPVELAGFACVLAVYIDARSGSFARARATRLAASGLALLVIAAALEGLLSPV